jgi:hypothetical protein
MSLSQIKEPLMALALLVGAVWLWNGGGEQRVQAEAVQTHQEDQMRANPNASTIANLISQWTYEFNQCRGEATQHCNRRDEIQRKLQSFGLCWWYNGAAGEGWKDC